MKGILLCFIVVCFLSTLQSKAKLTFLFSRLGLVRLSEFHVLERIICTCYILLGTYLKVDSVDSLQC